MWDQAEPESWAWGRSGDGGGSPSSACVPVLFTVGHAGDRRKGRVSPLGCREVALAQSVCQGSCASLGSCLASPGGVRDCWHCVGSSPAAPAALLRAGWDRGIDLPSVAARMKWSILHPAPLWLPFGLGSSLCTAGTAGSGRARSLVLSCSCLVPRDALPEPQPRPGL